jgi:SRSO17 transposase
MHVDQFPKFLQSTFRPQRRWFSRIGFDHFRFLIVALLINARSNKLSHLASAIPRHGHRTSHARFLKSDWDAAGILSAQAERIIRQMKPGKREAIYLLIDDTRIRKRGRKMDAVSKI